ncbi:MAG: glycosyltransferase [Desulfobulbaceae bacterium]|nr:glycosyltransferase [Desulfobulbaceae bacterium]
MKILYLNPLVSNDPNNLYGAMLHAHEFIKAVRELGHDIDVYPANHSSGDFTKCIQYATHKLSTVFSQSEFLIKYYSGVVQDLVLRKVLNSLVRNCDCIVARTSIMTFHTLEMLKNSGYPYILELNALLHKEKSDGLSANMLNRMKVRELKILDAANAIIVVSPELKKTLCTHDIAESKIHVNPNGVNTEAFTPHILPYPIRQRHQLPEEYIVGFLGNVKPSCDLRTLILAVSRVVKDQMSVHLVLAGKGTDSKAVKDIVQSHGMLRHVTQVGFVPRNQAPAYLSAMDILVSSLHSGYGYMSPLKDFEYMAMGKPIIATNVGQSSPIHEKSRTAMLVEPENIKQMATAINYLIKNKDKASAMGQAAREIVLAKYTWKHNADRVINVCRTVMSEKTSC